MGIVTCYATLYPNYFLSLELQNPTALTLGPLRTPVIWLGRGFQCTSTAGGLPSHEGQILPLHGLRSVPIRLFKSEIANPTKCRTLPPLSSISLIAEKSQWLQREIQNRHQHSHHPLDNDRSSAIHLAKILFHTLLRACDCLSTVFVGWRLYTPYRIKPMVSWENGMDSAVVKVFARC